MKIAENTYLTVLGVKFTVKKKFKRWYIAFNINNKRKNKSTGLESTKKNLIVVKNEIIPQLAEEIQAIKLGNQSTILVDKETILEVFAEKCFILHKEKVRAHVYERDLSNYQRHILLYFKGRNLTSIKPMELENWQNRLMYEYKPSSVKKYRSIFYGIFTRALQNEIMSKNPFDSVPAPRSQNSIDSQEDDEINPFTQKEIDILINADDDTYMPNFIKLMANSGIRPGELIALTWDDIDFNKRTINIDKTIVNGIVGLPKTKSSIRKIDMLQASYEALQEQYKLTSTFDNVFISSESKRFYSHDIINLNLKKRLIAHNIEVRSLYQLRHSFASRMIKSGVDITWVSKTLGHKDVSITLERYTKFIKEDEQTRLDNLAKIDSQISES